VAAEEQIQRVLNSLAEIKGCAHCGTSIRFGDLDCPHCGADLEDDLRRWAEKLVQALEE